MSDSFIIDCHYHPIAGRLPELCWYGKTGPLKAQIDLLRRAGISMACGSPIENTRGLPPSFAAVRRWNDIALRIRDKHPQFYIPGIQVHPAWPDESCAEIDRCCGKQGVRWIGELVGYMHGWKEEEYASAAMIQIVRHAGKLGATVNFHADWAHDVVERMCRKAPGTSFVIAHPGGMKDGMVRMKLVAKLPNLYLDISGTGIDRYRMLRKAVDIAGRSKLMFGTDYPINNPAVYVAGVMLEPLTAAERKAIFAGNFLRVTGLRY